MPFNVNVVPSNCPVSWRKYSSLVPILFLLVHPSIHCSMGSAPVGVQCPLTPSLGEFQVIGTGYGILAFRPYWCPSPFPLPSIYRCFSIYLPLNFILNTCIGPIL